MIAKTLLLLTLILTVESRRRRTYDKDHVMQELAAAWAEPPPHPPGPSPEPFDDSLNCDQAMDALLLRLPEFGSFFYMLVNGWYLGQWADYSSCLSDATDSQYVLATVNGQYEGPFEFSRGGQGKYTNGFSTRMGLCFPKQCTEQEVRGYTEELIRGYAEGIGWTGVTVDYHRASLHASE